MSAVRAVAVLVAAGILAAGISVLFEGRALAHCDTTGGPVIPEAKAALEKGDVTPILKWVKVEYEAETKSAFGKAVAVRDKGPEAKALADRYFLETLVRLHRAGEGAPYSGIKDEPAEAIVAMADKALVDGSADGMIKAINEHMAEAIKEKFNKAAEARKNKDKSVEAGREFVEAYVTYMHYVEGVHAAIVAAAGHHHVDAAEGAAPVAAEHKDHEPSEVDARQVAQGQLGPGVSPLTRRILGSLKDTVSVTVYASERDTPPGWTRQRERLRDLLRECQKIGGDRTACVFRDPMAGDQKVEAEAREAGMQLQTMQDLPSPSTFCTRDIWGASTLLQTMQDVPSQSTDQKPQKAGWLGMVVKSKGKRVTIPLIRPVSSLEYHLTRAINIVAQVDIPTIGFLAPVGNPYVQQSARYENLAQFLEQEGFAVKRLEASNLTALDKNVKLLIAMAPQELNEEALYRIDQYVMGGGKLFVAATGVRIDERDGQTKPKASNINLLLDSYGLKIDANLVEDWGKGKAQQFQTMRGPVATTNPFIMDVTDLSTSSLITSRLPGLVMVFPSGLSKADHPVSNTVEVLARSSSRSRKQDHDFVLQPDRVKPPSKSETLGSYNLVMSASGPMQSRYASAASPKITGESSATLAFATHEPTLTSARESQVVVAASEAAFLNDVIGNGNLNATFVANVADVLTRGGEFVELRSHGNRE